MIKLIKTRIPEKSERFRVFWFLLVYSNTFAFIAYAKNVNLLTNIFISIDLIGVLAYVLMIAVLEAGFVFIILLLWSNLLPESLFRIEYTKWAVIWFIGVTIFLYPFIVPISATGLDEFYTPLIEAQNFGVFLVVWMLVIFVIIAALRWLLYKSWADRLFNNLLERISVLAKFYLAIDLAGLLIVIFRNIFKLL